MAEAVLGSGGQFAEGPLVAVWNEDGVVAETMVAAVIVSQGALHRPADGEGLTGQSAGHGREGQHAYEPGRPPGALA